MQSLDTTRPQRLKAFATTTLHDQQDLHVYASLNTVGIWLVVLIQLDAKHSAAWRKLTKRKTALPFSSATGDCVRCRCMTAYMLPAQM
jgi:hypothetical protein